MLSNKSQNYTIETIDTIETLINMLLSKGDVNINACKSVYDVRENKGI